MVAQRKYPEELRERAIRMLFEVREREGKGHGELDVRNRIGYVPQAIGTTLGGADPACTLAGELRDQAALYRLSAAAGRPSCGRI